MPRTGTLLSVMTRTPRAGSAHGASGSSPPRTLSPRPLPRSASSSYRTSWLSPSGHRSANGPIGMSSSLHRRSGGIRTLSTTRPEVYYMAMQPIASPPIPRRSAPAPAMTPMETATVATAATAARPRLGAPKLVLLLGPPGSGKTMHAAQLAKRHHLLHLSTGAILRKYLDTDPRSEAEISPQRGALRKAVLAGELVSDDVIVKLLCDTLRAQLEPQQTLALLSPSTRAAACRSDASLSTASGAVLQRPYCGVILDGFPRTAAQAQMLLQHLRVPDVTLQLEVPPATLTQRLSTRGRADDTPATIRHRLAQYEATLPGIRAVLAPTVATSPVAAPTASRGASATTAMGARGGLLTVPAHDAPETVLSRLAHHVQSTLGPTPAFHPPTRAPAEVKPIAATATPASCERRLRPRWASRVRLAA